MSFDIRILCIGTSSGASIVCTADTYKQKTKQDKPYIYVYMYINIAYEWWGCTAAEAYIASTVYYWRVTALDTL